MPYLITSKVGLGQMKCLVLFSSRFLVLQCSVRVIQGRWRETLKAREERRNFLVMKAAAVTIEASWRGHATRNRLHKVKTITPLDPTRFIFLLMAYSDD